MDRYKFYTESLLRKRIKNEIHKIKTKERVIEEHIRGTIRELIIEAKSAEEVPHNSTAINVLKDLLKQIIPTLKEDYKDLTSNHEQRESFRSHIINGVNNLLTISQLPDKTADTELNEILGVFKRDPKVNCKELAKKYSEVLARRIPHTKQEEAFLYKAKRILVKQCKEMLEQTPPKDNEDIFIDIEDNPNQGKTEEEQALDDFTIPGKDLTGRNMAMETFNKIESQVEDAYNLLSDEEDKETFKDYLITNLKMHFDKIEQDLQMTLSSEPDSPDYSQEL